MTILIFILVLVALIVVHELGHFFVAKWSGMRVDEFGIGYPPRALTFWKHNGTEYTLNWLPFGGFVKIYGEDDSMPETGKDPVDTKSFASKPHHIQALVLIAGIAMNMLFAWLLFSVTLAIGLPRALEDADIARVRDAVLVVGHVVEKSPAAEAGLQAGDTVLKAQYGTQTFTGAYPDAFTSFVANSEGKEITIEVKRAHEVRTLVATPKHHLVPDDPQRYALGIGITPVGTIPTSIFEAPVEGARITAHATKEIALGLLHFFAGVFTLSADLSQVSGPVGIAGAVGDASSTSLVALLSLTAVISINLALINILPIPALDGGRLLFVIIEAVTRKPIPHGFANTLNTLGFALLILLMVLVTGSDLVKLLF